MGSAEMSLTTEKKAHFEQLLRSHQVVFLKIPDDLSRTSLLYHWIDTCDTRAIRRGMRRLSFENIKVLKAEVVKLPKAGAVLHFTTP